MSDTCETDAPDTATNESKPDPILPDNSEDKINNVTCETNSELKNEEIAMEVQQTTEDSENQDTEKERHAPKRRLSVITISDSESDDSSVCHIDSYQASVSEAKKIRGDYSSASDSYTGSSGEDSDEENDESLVITLTSSVLSNRTTGLKTRAPRLSDANLNPCFISEELDEQFAEHWSKMEAFKSGNLTLHSNPYRICVLDNFLDNVDIVNNIVDDITTLDWSRSKMDLYEFHRSSDLVNLSWQRAIKSFYELLNDVVMKWVARITKQKLTHVSASCALYGPGDHLLVHDDLMSDRKVAFIYYMAPWDIPDAQQEVKTETEQENNEKDLDNSEPKQLSNETNKDSSKINEAIDEINDSNKTNEVIENANDSSKTNEVINETVDDSKTNEVGNENSGKTAEINEAKESSEIMEDDKETKEKCSGTDSDSKAVVLNSNSSVEAEKCDERPVRGWSKSMGGELEFFAVDSKGLPTVPVKSLLPCNNTFAFFKVGSNTFHQVSEVLSFDFPRLTINGWFHGPPDDGEETPEHVEELTAVPYKDLAENPHTDLFQTTMNEWISSTYLSPRTKFKIQQQIEQSSEISLEDFFLESQFDSVVYCLQDKSLAWQHQGPAHLRHHDVLPIDGAGEVIKQFCQLFNSNHFLRLLGDFTELRLKTYHSLQIQRWTAANYAVLPPKSHYPVTELDVIVYLGLPPKMICGGTTVYLAPEEAASEPLITVEMANNSLNLVYSDAGTSKFTKYVSKLSLQKDEYFYIVTCSYRE